MTTNNHDIRALVEQAEERFAKLYPDLEPTGKGRRASWRSMAIQEVSQTLQMDARTVRQKYRRAGLEPRRIRKEERERFDYLGVDVSESYRRMCKNIYGTLKTGQYALSSVKANLTKLVGRYPAPAPMVQRVLVLVDEAMQGLRGLTPVGICPWCKNIAGMREECTTCHKSGWLPESKKNIVPLMLRSKDVAMTNGKVTHADSSDQAVVPESQPPPPPEEAFPWDS